MARGPQATWGQVFVRPHGIRLALVTTWHFLHTLTCLTSASECNIPTHASLRQVRPQFLPHEVNAQSKCSSAGVFPQLTLTTSTAVHVCWGVGGWGVFLSLRSRPPSLPDDYSVITSSSRRCPPPVLYPCFARTSLLASYFVHTNPKGW